MDKFVYTDLKLRVQDLLYDLRKESILWQPSATRIDAVFRPFLVDSSINRKNIRFISYHLIFDLSYSYKRWIISSF